MIKYLLFLCLLNFSCKASDTVLIVKFDGVSDSIARGVAKNIEKKFKVSTNIISDSFPFKEVGFGYGYFAAEILNYLDSFYNNSFKVVAITTKELLHINFFYGPTLLRGFGSLSGSSAVISAADLDSTNIIKELSIISFHELGHTYGLYHCVTSDCYMYDGNGSIKAINERICFCKPCEEKLKVNDKSRR